MSQEQEKTACSAVTSCCKKTMWNLSAPKPQEMGSASSNSSTKQKAISFCLLQGPEEEAASFCFVDVVRALLPVGLCTLSQGDTPASKDDAVSHCFIEALRGLFPSSPRAILAKEPAVVLDLEKKETQVEQDAGEKLEAPAKEDAGAEDGAVQSGEAAVRMVIVTVRDAAGVALLGPVALAPSLTMAELRNQVLDQASKEKPLQVEIRHSSTTLDGDRQLQEVPGADTSNMVELTATVQALELSEWRRQRYIESLDGCWRQLRLRPQELQNFPLQFRADHACMLAALRRTGTEALLEFAHESLLADKEFMVSAVRERGCALRYAAAELIEDSEVVMEAATQNKDALRFAGEEFRSAAPLVRCSPCRGGPPISLCLPRAIPLEEV
jgi:hypothetical protein